MNKNIVTVGISTHNDEKTIENCLKSVLEQSFLFFEIILVNDGSSDKTDELIQKFLPDIRIRYINEKKCIGVSERHNQITRLAQGKYIARLDADDFMVKDRLKIQVALMESQPSIDLLSSYAYKIDQSGIPEKKKILGGKIHHSKMGLILKNNIVHSTVLAKKQFFQDNPYNMYFLRCQDLELWLRTISVYKFAIVKQPLIYYRQIKNKEKYFKSQLYRSFLIEKYKDEFHTLVYYLLKVVLFFKKRIFWEK